MTTACCTGLYDCPAVLHYKPADEPAFAAALLAQDNATAVFPIEDPRQLQLGSNGRTLLGGFRYAGAAFQQVCTLLGPGLLTVVTDLAGLRRRQAEDDPRDYSLTDATHLLNDVVSRRFRTRVDGLQFVLDERSKTIDGVVSDGYRRLANHALYERSRDALADADHRVTFHEGVLAGRRLLLRYAATTDLWTGSDPYCGGFSFANSESGDGAVGGAAVLLRRQGGTVALLRGSRVRHAGQHFWRRFARLLSTVASRPLAAERLAVLVSQLRESSLGFTANEDEARPHFLTLSRNLKAHGLTGGQARRVLRSALDHGAQGGTPIFDPAQARRMEWPQRCVYDVFVALGRAGQQAVLPHRERFERLAWKLLTGKFTLAG